MSSRHPLSPARHSREYSELLPVLITMFVVDTDGCDITCIGDKCAPYNIYLFNYINSVFFLFYSENTFAAKTFEPGILD